MLTFPIYPHMSRVKPPIYSLYVHGYPLTPIHIMWATKSPQKVNFQKFSEWACLAGEMLPDLVRRFSATPYPPNAHMAVNKIW